MKVRVGPAFSVKSVDCPKCGTRRYIDGEKIVKKCWWCGDAAFEVEIRPIDKMGNCEAIPKAEKKGGT